MSGKIDESETVGGAGSWMRHVKKTMRANKGMKLKDVLKMAKKTYKKSKKGGASISPFPLAGGEGAPGPTGVAAVGGRRRRSSRKGSKKTRKH
jgi:hypothetical protein